MATGLALAPRVISARPARTTATASVAAASTAFAVTASVAALASVAMHLANWGAARPLRGAARIPSVREDANAPGAASAYSRSAQLAPSMVTVVRVNAARRFK